MKVKKWFAVLLALIVLLTASLIVTVVVLTTGKTLEDGPETGVYYYDNGKGEDRIILNSGNKVTFLVGGENKTGEYQLENQKLVIKLASDREFSATLGDNVLTLNYSDAEMRFLKEIPYTVTFDAKSGTPVDAITVINGKTVAKPADPVRNGYTFIGWFTDENYTTPFLFGSQPVVSQMTLYAYWGQKIPGQSEFTVDFDLNCDAENPQSVQTVGGRLYTLPKPAERSGFVFQGWWVSMYDSADKLSYEFIAGETALQENTTLYALWKSADAQAEPNVSVGPDGFTWTAVPGVTTYVVTVTNPKGETSTPAKVSTLSYQYDFATAPAGDYVIRVSAESSAPRAVAYAAEDQASGTARYYRNKSLARVSLFSVVEPSSLVFQGVEGAQRYYITIECGNKQHQHDKIALGKSTNYNFSGCPMQEGGIRFTVTAEADGCLASESREFVYNRELAAISELIFDEATETLVWDPIPDAMSYVVSVKCGNSDHKHEPVDIGNRTNYCLKYCEACEGGIIVEVYPKTKGYNVPVACSFTYNRENLAAPGNIRLKGTQITWDAVKDADSYTVRIGSSEYAADQNSFDLSDYISAGNDYTIQIRARNKANSKTSLWSDSFEVRYRMSETLVYEQSLLTWDPVFGASYYEVQVNEGGWSRVDGVNFAEITLTKAGENTLRVRFVDKEGKASDYAQTEVNAYTVTFDTRGGSGTGFTQYKASGDKITLPTSSKDGYDFAGWYNVPGGADSNGAKFTEEIFDQTVDVTLYAYWTPKRYQVTYDATGGNLAATGAGVYFERNFTLDVPTNDDTTVTFGGWYEKPDGKGTRYTDAKGKSVAPWPHAEDATVYACWREVLNLIETKSANGDPVYAVQKGPHIDMVTSVRIPTHYNDLPVAIIYSGAFLDCSNLVTIEIPDTIESIGSTTDSSGPFSGCSKLEAVNIYHVEGTHTRRYQSIDGALLDQNQTSGTLRFAYFPTAKTGTYHIPDGVQEIPLKVFANASISTVYVPASVTAIRQTAFYNCKTLTQVIFESASQGAEQPLLIESRAFQGCTGLTEITLPKRLNDLSVVANSQAPDVFTGCSNLMSVYVESGNEKYSSVDGLLCDQTGATVLFCPWGRSGAVTLPVGITAVGSKAFEGRDKITEIVIPANVSSIGENAFAACANLKKVTFSGSLAPSPMEIGANAFYDCRALNTVSFDERSNVVKLNDYAFAFCTGLKEIVIPASMEQIGAYAFQSCTSLGQVAFTGGGKVLEFGNYIFSDCIALERVELSASVETLPLNVFQGCDNIAGIYVDDVNQYYADKEGVLFNKDFSEILFYSQLSGNYTIPETVTTIGENAFANNRAMTSLTIGKNVTQIKANAFFRCMELTELVFAEGGTEALILDEYAFGGCTNIESIALPERLTKIGDYAFDHDGSLTQLTFGGKEESIGSYAFAGTSLTKVVIPDSVATLGQSVFDNCSYLAEVTLPAGMEIVGNSIFSNCYALSSVVLPDGLKTIGENAFLDCVALDTIELPSTVTTIANYAFRGCTSLAQIVIPKSVTSIGMGAFFECTSLANVSFQPGGTDDLVLQDTPEVGDYSHGVFYNCTALTSIRFPARLTQVGTWCFYRSNNIASVVFEEENGISRLQSINERAFVSVASIEELVLPNGLKVIDEAAFGIASGVGRLKSVTFPSSVTFIGNISFQKQPVLAEVIFAGGNEALTIDTNAFLNCTSLKEVTLPANLKTLGNGVFSGCTALTAVKVADGNKSFSSLNGVVCEAENGSVVIFPAAKTGTYTVPDGVTSIPANTFQNSQLTSIVLPETLTSIGNNAFTGSAITSIRIPASVTTIGNNAFDSCTKLGTVTFAENSKLQSIGQRAFQKSKITSIELPEGLTEISTYVFDGCTALGSVKLPSSLAQISNYAFRDCTSLASVVIPEGIQSIGTNVFANCTSLQSVTVPASVTSIGNNAFLKCTKLDTVTFVDKVGAPDLIFENGSTSSSASSTAGIFNGCTALREIKLPARLTSLGSYAFSGCPNLAKVEFAEGSRLTNIGNLAFWKSGLVSIVLPSTVETLGDTPATNTTFGVFNNCHSLQSVTLPAALTSFSWNRFIDCPALKEVLVDEKSQSFSSIDGVLFNKAKTELIYYPIGRTETSYEIPASTLSIGEKAFFHARSTSSTNKYDDFAKNLQKIVIPESLTEIKANAFQYCGITSIEFAEKGNLAMIGNYAFANNTAITSVTIPASVETLGMYVFDACSNLTGVTFEVGNLTEIGNYCFRGTALTGVVIPDSVTTLGTYLFQNCKQLADVTLPNTLERLPNYIFSGCSALASIEIPESVTEIGSYAFQNCSLLESIDFPAGVTSIGTYAFQGCAELVEIALPNGVQEIGNNAFQNCRKLESITMPNSVTRIGANAFENCVALVEIAVPAGVTDIGNNAFKGCTKLERVEMLPGVATIGMNAFQNCTSLTDLRIMGTVTSIGNNAFDNCPNLKLELDEDNVSYAVVDGVLYDNLMTTLLYFPLEKTGEYVIPEGVTTIVSGIFANRNVTKITIPSSMTVIGDSYFKDCKTLSEIVLHDRLTFIGNNAFQNTAIESVNIGRYVTNIGDYAFDGCKALASVTFGANGSSSLQLGEYAFRNCIALTAIQLPRRVRNYRQNTTGVTGVLMLGIDNYCFAGCTNLASVTFEQNGAWLLTERLTIGDYAFQNCSSLTEIDLPSYVGNVYYAVSGSAGSKWYFALGKYCFSGCSELASVKFNRGEDSSFYIGDYAFQNCTTLESIDLPVALSLSKSSQGNNMFSGCISLKRASIPLTGNADNVFKGCTELESVVLLPGQNATSYMGVSMFEGCTSLKNVELPFNLYEIYQSAFKGCTSLESLMLPIGLKTISANTFEGCTGLKELKLPNTLKEVGASAFKGWTAAQTITVDLTEAPAGWNSAWNSDCKATVEWKQEN